ncbi:MAG: helix-turn-helix transcriptional regulator [bacterium]
MHDHIKIIGIIIVFILGLGIIFYLLNIKNKYKDNILNWLICYIVAYNSAILLVLTRKYIEVNLKGLVPLPFAFTEFASDIETTLNLFRLASIFIIIALLQKKDISKFVIKYCLMFELIVLIIISIKYSLYNNPISYKASTQFLDVLTYVIFYYEPFLLVVLFFQNIKSEKSLFKSLVQWFSVLFLMRYLFFFFFYVIPINIIGYYDKYLQATLILSSILVFNTVPFFWLKFFYEKYQASLAVPKLIKIETSFQQFGISEREKEIINLILEGKTNKEIEAVLYLSGHTVKNHIYHIYQKLRINSRYQLISKFGNKI